MNTRAVSTVALGSAVSAALMYAMSSLPTMRIALFAVLSAAGAVTVIRCGIKSGAAQYAVSSALAFLLIPQKAVAVAYFVFVGHYPLCKSLIERLDRLWLEWILKIAVFNFCFGACCILASLLLDLTVSVGIPILFIGADIVFVIYDMALTVLIDFLSKRIRLI